MFTGLIAAIGTIQSISQSENKSTSLGSASDYLARFTVSAPSDFLKNTALGDSIAISGACMTVTALTCDSFSFDVSPESLKKTILSRLKPGDAVNLEKPVTPNQPMGGHFVSGHVDGLAYLEALQAVGECHQLG
ncbi:MAG: hypothetical protein VKK59_01525, partial [Vampirovibrionales bacterium]|nr:hypothetical protein [Vampirovibrionales bacterium]